MDEVKIGSHVHWHIEGTLDQVEEGVVVALLKWPLSGGIRAYVVEPDDPAIIAGIVPASSVVERTQQPRRSEHHESP